MRHKKRWIRVAAVVSACVIACAGILVYVKNRPTGSVNVYSVNLITGWYEDSNYTSSGTVEKGHTQTVTLADGETVASVFVTQGQQVKEGDPLFQYDTTVQELTIERQNLTVQSDELSLTMLQKEIEQLKSQIPSSYLVTQKPQGQDSSSDSSDSSENDPDSPGHSESDSEASGSSDSSTLTQKGTKEDPLIVFVSADNPIVEAPVWQGCIGKYVRFIVVKGNTPDEGGEESSADPSSENSDISQNEDASDTSDFLYSILADLREAQPLAQGENVTLEIQQRKIRDTVSIITILQQNWPGNITVQMPLEENFRTDDLMLTGVTQADVNLSLTAGDNRTITFEIPKGGIYLLTSAGQTVPVPDDSDSSADDSQDDSGDIEPDVPDDDIIPDEPDVTPAVDYSELVKQLNEKQSSYNEQSIQMKLDKIELQKEQKDLDAMTVKSETDGTVSTLADLETLQSGEPYIVVSATEGCYVRGSMSELDLARVQNGSTVTITDWMTGNMYSGEVISTDDYPVDGSDSAYAYGGDGNPNVSYYGFRAKVTANLSGGDIDLEEGSSVQIQVDEDQVVSDSLFITDMFVREENGTYYVMKQGEDGTLVKQTVEVGKRAYSVCEIISGLTTEDYLAFPYGNEVKEGAKCVIKEDLESLYGY